VRQANEGCDHQSIPTHNPYPARICLGTNQGHTGLIHDQATVRTQAVLLKGLFTPTTPLAQREAVGDGN
jgi:hypothetical protein